MSTPYSKHHFSICTTNQLETFTKVLGEQSFTNVSTSALPAYTNQCSPFISSISLLAFLVEMEALA